MNKIIKPSTIKGVEDSYIQLRAKLLVYIHEQKKSNYSLSMEGALNEVRAELTKEKNWGVGLKLSLEEVTLMEDEQLALLYKERTKHLMKLWLNKLDKEDKNQRNEK